MDTSKWIRPTIRVVNNHSETYSGISGKKLLAIEIFLLPLWIPRPSQLSQPRLQSSLMIRSTICTEPMQDIQCLNSSSPILFNHFTPQLSQYRIIDVVSSRYLICNSYKSFHVLSFDGSIIWLCCFEHDLFKLRRCESLDLTVEIIG